MKLDEIFAELAAAEAAAEAASAAQDGAVYTPPTLQEIRFPELFVY